MSPLPISPHAFAGAGIAALVGWRIYRRMKMLIGRQRVRVWRLAATTTFFGLAIVTLALVDLDRPPLVEGLVAGTVVGIALAFVGLRLTRFEVGDEGCAYVPNTKLGLAVSLLFVARLVYRFAVIWLAPGDAETNALGSFGSSALTLACFGLVAAYYATFAAGVLAWYRTVRRSGGAPVADVPSAPGA